jgi:Secretion system C-terminal sorting domain
MKTLIATILILIATNFASAQFELHGAGVVGDTVKVWNTNIYTSCGAKFIASVSLPKDSIVVTEQDTSTRHMVCGCYYDVNVSLTGLTPGNYQIVIYRQESKVYQYSNDTLILVASFSFSIAGANAQQPSTKILASDCHNAPVSVHQDQIASNYLLLTSYPNPFNPNTTIRYSIPQTAIVTLEVFDDVGRGVATLVNEKKNAGEYSVQFDASKLGSGVYICRLVVGNNLLTNKLVLLK